MQISVALCTYNGEKFIHQQIDSILKQSLKVDEIVVCDDGSNDKTIEILNDYSKKNPDLFKIHQNEKNLRSVKNFEKAIHFKFTPPAFPKTAQLSSLSFTSLISFNK